MTNAIFNHMSEAIMANVEVSEEGGQASLFLWENAAEEFVQLFVLFRSLFISRCVFLCIFLRKHNHSQLT